MSGIEYEFFCKEQLELLKWDVALTKKTGDQGVDLIAKKNNRTVAIQCKRHSKPISNKAVQEIFAGMKFYNIDHGVIISNNKFTTSAANLAYKSNIRLIHHDDLESL
jgi:restriction system protein